MGLVVAVGIICRLASPCSPVYLEDFVDVLSFPSVRLISHVAHMQYFPSNKSNNPLPFHHVPLTDQIMYLTLNNGIPISLS